MIAPTSKQRTRSPSPKAAASSSRQVPGDLEDSPRKQRRRIQRRERRKKKRTFARAERAQEEDDDGILSHHSKSMSPSRSPARTASPSQSRGRSPSAASLSPSSCEGDPGRGPVIPRAPAIKVPSKAQGSSVGAGSKAAAKVRLLPGASQGKQVKISDRALSQDFKRDEPVDRLNSRPASIEPTAPAASARPRLPQNDQHPRAVRYYQKGGDQGKGEQKGKQKGKGKGKGKGHRPPRSKGKGKGR